MTDKLKRYGSIWGAALIALGVGWLVQNRATIASGGFAAVEWGGLDMGQVGALVTTLTGIGGVVLQLLKGTVVPAVTEMKEAEAKRVLAAIYFAEGRYDELDILKTLAPVEAKPVEVPKP